MELTGNQMSLLPLESNPEVMNQFLHYFGVPNKWNIVDVYGLDGDALAWVPRPVLAVILLFPCSKQFYDHAEKEAADLKAKGQKLDPGLFYMKQYVSNACGTIALIHSVANNTDRIELSDSAFRKILDESRELSPEQRGKLLLESSNSEAFNLITAHQQLATQGQTEVVENCSYTPFAEQNAKNVFSILLFYLMERVEKRKCRHFSSQLSRLGKVNPNEQVNHHFVAFVEKGGQLYELDGRKEFPINHGPTTPDTLLEDAAKVCKTFIERDSEDVNFTVMALTATD